MAAIALAGLTALAVAMGIGRFAFTPILPMMQADAGLSVVQGGWLASANYAGYLAGGLSALSLRMAPARVIHLGLLLVAASTLAMGLTGNLLAWIALRTIAGVASAWVLVFASAWCLEQLHHEPSAPRRSLLGAAVFSGVGIGIMVAGMVCVALLTAHARWWHAWLALGVLAFASAAAIWKLFDAPAPAPSATSHAGRRWDPEWMRMVLCYGAFGFGYIIPATFLATMAREVSPDPAVYGWSWPLFGAAAAVSTVAAAAFRRRFSERALWVAGHLVMATGVMVPVVWRGLGGIVLSALLVGGTFMVVTMAGMQEARRVAGAAARPLIAAMTSAFALGQIAGPLAVSALAARGAGFTSVLVAAGVLLVASGLALLAFGAQPASR
jgi:predicted MFS family arabinose efflux permease